jgi:hypothetical protein
LRCAQQAASMIGATPFGLPKTAPNIAKDAYIYAVSVSEDW